MSNRKRDSRKRKMARRLRNRTKNKAARRKINDFENSKSTVFEREIAKLEHRIGMRRMNAWREADARSLRIADGIEEE